jgi:protein phosphatase
VATDTIALTYSKLRDLPPADALLKATQEANQQIHDRGEADPEFRGMGTTCTVLLLLPQGALVSHVGDSRAYRLRGNRLDQLTFDHSLIWEMRAAGQVGNDEIHEYIPRNIITRSLGPGPNVQVDLEGPFPIAPGDTFLLCSDGLSGPVEDKEIGLILGAMPPAEAVRALVDLANLRGGPDNITVVVARVKGSPLSSAGGPRRESLVPPRPPGAVHPLVWTLLGVFTLAAAGAAAMQYWGTALLCLAGSVLAGIMALAQRYGPPETNAAVSGRPRGKGPYRSSVCTAEADFVEGLSRIVEELRDAATREDWTVDWSRFNALLSEATAARETANQNQVIQRYFAAISFVMAQLKLGRASGPDESPPA